MTRRNLFRTIIGALAGAVLPKSKVQPLPVPERVTLPEYFILDSTGGLWSLQSNQKYQLIGHNHMAF